MLLLGGKDDFELVLEQDLVVLPTVFAEEPTSLFWLDTLGKGLELILFLQAGNSKLLCWLDILVMDLELTFFL